MHMDSTATATASSPPPSSKRPNEDADAPGSPDPKRAKPAEDGIGKGTGKGKGKGKAKDKDDKNSKKAGRRRRGRDTETGYGEHPRASVSIDGEPKAKTPRLPKRMCALLIGFCGSGYSGMQIQQNARTIENTLFDALVRIGAVSKDNADDPVKVGLGRAARTDAGVHAAGNVVALKMITEVPGVADLAARINEELPPEIRLWGHIRVQNSFNPRTLCDSRKYTYFFPSYLLIPPKPTSPLYRVLAKHAASPTSPMESPMAGNAFWSCVDTVMTEADGQLEEDGDRGTAPTEEEAADTTRKRAWRIGPEQMDQLRAGAQRYLATHNFHNFTVNGAFGDRSNQRVMKNIEIADPVVYGQTEWISVLFHGQSFMMHQIRKMISALVLTVRTGTPPQIIDELYGPRDVFIPKMPALGLLLEQPIFDSYNTRVGNANEQLKEGEADNDYRPPVDFEKHKAEMEAFKEEWIYRNMRMVEERDGLFDAWIRMVDSYGGTDLLYLNPRGTIPAAAVIQLPPLAEGKTKGKERYRKGGFREKKLFDATSFPVGGVGAAASGEEDEEDADEQALRTGKKEELDG